MIPNNVERIFRSKIDTWLVYFLLTTAVPAFYGVYSAFRGAPAPMAVWTLMVVTALYGFVLWVFSTTTYTVTDTRLVIRSGPFRWTIARDQIHSVHETRNPLSSPALSLDRLEIGYGDGRTVRVSPRDKAGFMHALDLPQQSGDRQARRYCV